MLEEKGLFAGDLGEQRRHMQDVVGRIGSDMRLLEEKGRNMVARLSEMRGTLSGSEHQRRVSSELEDVERQLDEVRAAADLAQKDVDEFAPAAGELHNRRVELDDLISKLNREQRDAQRTVDGASLELAKVRESLSNAELEDSMYASRLEQIEENIENIDESLVSRRDRAEEVEDLLRTAREEQDEAKLAIETARGALEGLRRRESEARQRVSEVRSGSQA